ncbi:hypothetical protein PPSIR1_28473 [Plesiocystis pacifica SIR-1]|uniref:Thioredoxin domain-containing protein n=2 Tax=Plesiocystis pacifica TaxID=191768 RepID=A6FZW7_9BACT|nr:hypothetical protein PPSIR1_28473 [Plesiocystis pacifica SIR-1]
MSAALMLTACPGEEPVLGGNGDDAGTEAGSTGGTGSTEGTDGATLDTEGTEASTGESGTTGESDTGEPACVGVTPILDPEPETDTGEDTTDGGMDTDTGVDTDTGTETDTGGETTDTGGETTTDTGEEGTETGEPPCPECAPIWDLYDFQPQSCGYTETYGLDSFEGHVTLIAMLAGWCSYCQSQAGKMEEMRLELALEGYDVQMIAINATSADNDDDRQNLVDRCAFPLFQDIDEVDAWDLHGGTKDDLVIYHADGTMAVFLDQGGEVNTNLSTDEGYANVKQALLDAF